MGQMESESAPDCLNSQVAAACGFLTVPDCEHNVTLAMAAYEVMRERGWRIYSVHDHPARNEFSVGMVRYVSGALPLADASGATFPEALCRALVKAGRRG